MNLQYFHSSLWIIQNGFFYFFNNERHCCIKFLVNIFSKINFLFYFRVIMLVVYWNPLLSSYNIIWNRDNLVHNHLCNHLPDQSQSFECYHILLNHFLQAHQNILSISHNIVIFYCVSCSNRVIFKWWNKISVYSLKTQIN